MGQTERTKRKKRIAKNIINTIINEHNISDKKTIKYIKDYGYEEAENIITAEESKK